MKHFVLVLIAFCLFGFGTTIQAQVSIPASGGNAAGTGGTVSYTTGQVVYTPLTGAGTITQGVQQPFEITVVTAVKEATDIILDFLVYPNPVNDLLNLKCGSYNLDNLSYTLYDMNGTLFQNNKIESSETHILMGSNTPGTYFLKIVAGNRNLKTFKIIKK